MAKEDEIAELMDDLELPKEKIVEAAETLGKLRKKVVERSSASLIAKDNRGLFKARMGDSGRIVIPEPERAALELEKGDLVQIDLAKIETKTKE